jgi:hypothetical protein
LFIGAEPVGWPFYRGSLLKPPERRIRRPVGIGLNFVGLAVPDNPMRYAAPLAFSFARDLFSERKSAMARLPIRLVVAIVAASASLGVHRAQAAGDDCSWPLVTTGTGLTNVAYPDKNATYWSMPLDRTLWRSMIIDGVYPKSRFFSFVSYTGNGQAVDDIVDVNIAPNSGSSNPFVRGASGVRHQYRVTVGGAASSPNNVTLEPITRETKWAWVIYRIYVPDRALDRNAGVPLPKVTLVGAGGRRLVLKPCKSKSGNPAGADAQRPLHPAFQTAQLQQGAANSATVSCQPQNDVVFWIPQNSGGYFSNPGNKYIAAPDLCFDANKVLVVRGKAAGYPDTYAGKPVWTQAIPGVPIQLRYWSMCNNDQTSPYPVVGCEADYGTKLDKDGMYTYVVAPAERRKAPTWIPSDATWLPWGLKNVSNDLLFRNMLPNSQFKQSVQYAESKGCTAPNNTDNPPTRQQVVDAGDCAQHVMGAFYPRAVFCTKQTLIKSGWRGCLAAAGKTAR